MAIVIRGAAFGLRTESAARQARSAKLLGRAFGAGSIAAPLLFGASAAALAQVSSSTHGPTTVSSLPWTGLFAAIVGLLAVSLCAHLAATFVTYRLKDTGQTALADRFRRQHAPSTLFLRAERESDGRRTHKLAVNDPLPTSYGQDLYDQLGGWLDEDEVPTQDAGGPYAGQCPRDGS